MSVVVANGKYTKSFFNFILKWQMPNRSSYDKIQFYSRSFLVIFPFWYLGVPRAGFSLVWVHFRGIVGK
jgi:hypothetical protein